MSRLPLLLGIEIGGTKLQLGLGHDGSSIVDLERRTIEPARGAEGILAQVSEAYAVLARRSGIGNGVIAAAGIGFGGPVDAARGVVLRSHQVAGWDDFPLTTWVRDHLAIPRVELQNDADTAGLGEARFGAGIGMSPILYVTIGSGIGGGLIIDRQIYRGGGLGAIEIGHLWVVDRMSCDRDVVKLEDVASGWAIARSAREYAERAQRGDQAGPWLALEMAGHDASRITPEILARAARRGDQEAAFLLAKATSALANALNQAVILLAPRRIILGGGVSLIGDDLWFEPIRTWLDHHVFPPFRGAFDVVPSALGESVVLHGALAQAHDAIVSDVKAD
jgi:glucokinase